jgi:hypothetical protein
MMRDGENMESIKQIIELREKRQRRGDTAFVAFFFVVAVPVAAIVFLLTGMFVGSNDTVRAFVPKNAVVYVHMSGDRATRMALESSVRMPSDVHPREIAVFAIPGDDGLQWSSVLAWSAPMRPTSQEMKSLAASGAIQIDGAGRRFLIGDPSVATEAKLAFVMHSSIADDAKTRSALDAAESRASVQIFADSDALISQEHLTGIMPVVNANGVVGPFVAGITYRDGEFDARSVAADDVKKQSASVMDVPSLVGELGRVDADVAASEPSAGFDLALLFGGGESSDSPFGTAALAGREENLREVLNGPHSLWISRDSSGSGLSFLLHYPAVGTSVAETSIGRLIAAEKPSLDTLTMPDGDTAEEYRAEPAALPTDHNDLTFAGTDQSPIIVGSDGESGSLITNSAALLADYRSTKNALPQPSCGTNPYSEVRTAHLADLSAADPNLHAILNFIHIQSITFGQDVDKKFYICGKLN